MSGNLPPGCTQRECDEAQPGYWDENDEWDDGQGDDCNHEEYEIDLLSGRAHCDRCPHSWHATADEMRAEVERIRRYHEWETEQNHPWNRFKEWARDKIDALAFWRRWRKSRARPIDDEIPF